MTQKQYSRSVVVNQIIEGKITISESSKVLSLSERQIKRLKAEYLRKGDDSFVHGNTNRKPAHTIDEETRNKIIDLVKRKYYEYSCDYIRDLLDRKEGINVSVSTVRRILSSANVESKGTRNGHYAMEG